MFGMSNNEASVTTWIKRLHEGDFDTAGNARKSLGSNARIGSWTEEDKNKGFEAINKFFQESKPLTEEAPVKPKKAKKVVEPKAKKGKKLKTKAAPVHEKQVSADAEFAAAQQIAADQALDQALRQRELDEYKRTGGGAVAAVISGAVAAGSPAAAAAARALEERLRSQEGEGGSPLSALDKMMRDAADKGRWAAAGKAVRPMTAKISASDMSIHAQTLLGILSPGSNVAEEVQVDANRLLRKLVHKMGEDCYEPQLMTMVKSAG